MRNLRKYYKITLTKNFFLEKSTIRHLCFIIYTISETCKYSLLEEVDKCLISEYFRKSKNKNAKAL